MQKLGLIVGITLFTCLGIFQTLQAQHNALLSTSQRKEAVFMITEIPPKPIGGMSAFYEYTEDNLKRPVEARQKGIRGNVYVQFIIEKDGRLSNIKVLKGIGFGCDEAVVNLLKKAPKWNPGKQNGKVVRVQKTMSIKVR